MIMTTTAVLVIYCPIGPLIQAKCAREANCCHGNHRTRTLLTFSAFHLILNYNFCGYTLLKNLR